MAEFLYGDKGTIVVSAPTHLLEPPDQQQSREDHSSTALPLTRYPEQDQSHLSLRSWRKPSGSPHLHFSALEKQKTNIWGTRPQELKSSSSCYSQDACPEAMDAGIGQPLFPAFYPHPYWQQQKPPGSLYQIAQAILITLQQLPPTLPLHSLFCVPAPVLPCQDVRDPQLRLLKFPCLEQSCTERWNHLVISACVGSKIPSKHQIVHFCVHIWIQGGKDGQKDTAA